MLHPAVGEVEVVGDGRILGSQGVNLLDIRHNALAFTVTADAEHCIIDCPVIWLQNVAGNLKVAESVDLGMKQFLNREALNGIITLKAFL